MSGDQQEMLGAFVGHLIFFAILMAVGVGMSAWLGSRRSDKKFVWWPSVVSAALVGVALVSTFSRFGAADAAAGKAMPKVTPEVLRQKLRLGARLPTDDASLRTMETKAKAAMAQQGKIASGEIVVRIVAIQVGHQKLILQKAWWQKYLVNSEIMTLRDGEMIGINCTSSQADVLPPKFKGTACGAEVLKVLNVDVSTLSGDI
ncbi:hypothetical protein [Sphingomonas sp. HMP6]|uniref:hypothetical protein n=1 Tax=Sphingomonas sp. HMP6 TaxID=1517551 RepID=UPI0015963F88|nr:hypothetical protein [Sphingomonas sp. HMP6]BCA58495.1 hypothetical protein HMP06_1264 [Sphingomonas sp. HMP6]